MSEKKRIELNTPKGRAMFVNLRQPRKVNPQDPNETPKYSMALVFDADAQKTKEFKAMEKAVKEVAEAEWGEIPKKMKSPFITTDDLEKVPDGMEEGDVMVRLNSTSRQQVVDRKVQEILDDAEIYSGMYAVSNVQCYAWNHKQGGKGVSFGLGPVQKLNDGEPLGGGAKPAKDAFAAVPDEDDDLDDDDDSPF